MLQHKNILSVNYQLQSIDYDVSGEWKRKVWLVSGFHFLVLRPLVQSVACMLAAMATPGSLLEMRDLRPH